MKILSFKKQFFNTLAILLFPFFMSAQEKSNGIFQDAKFEQLLNEKRKVNASFTTNDRYKIQIFSGESEKAKAELTEFKKKFKTSEATIVFNTPSYKVWVGNFKTRIEAERNLALILKKYKTALLIRPGK